MSRASTAAALAATERTEAIAWLLEHLAPRTKIYAILRHVSASGGRREISLYYHDGGDLVSLDYHVGRALELRHGKHGGLVIDGGGMDMGFKMVYSLGKRMWPDGTPEPHGQRNRTPDSDGGYALERVWL